jgi:hypothetical protein
MTVECTKCFTKIEDGDLRANYPTGVQCINCAEEYHNKHLKGKKLVDVHAHFDREIALGKQDTIEIGEFDIPKELLTDYADKVSYVRRAGIYSMGKDDPLIVTNALRARIKAHKKIYEFIGLPYPDFEDPYAKHDKNSLQFQADLSRWLESLPGMKAEDFGIKID